MKNSLWSFLSFVTLLYKLHETVGSWDISHFDWRFIFLFNSVKVYLFLTLLSSDHVDGMFFMILFLFLFVIGNLILFSYDLPLNLGVFLSFLWSNSIDVSIYVLCHIWIKNEYWENNSSNFLCVYFVIIILTQLSVYFIFLH